MSSVAFTLRDTVLQVLPSDMSLTRPQNRLRNAFTQRDAVLEDLPDDPSLARPQNRLRNAESPLWTKTVSLANASGWLVGTLHRLHDVARLPDNWNSYGAVAPNATALANAQNFLHELSELDFEPSRIDPSAENGVCISFRAGNRYADIECFNSGDVLAVTSDGSGQPQIWEIIAASGDDLRMAVAQIRTFVRS
jgi:hypothetical protein